MDAAFMRNNSHERLKFVSSITFFFTNLFTCQYTSKSSSVIVILLD